MSKSQKSRIRLQILLITLGLAVGLVIGKIFFQGTASIESGPVSIGSLGTDLDKYYPKHFSWNNEEIIIRHFFKDRRGGFFLDVGAYHYKNGSNTYYLEKYLDWKGIAIDANPQFADGYQKNRPKTTFFNFFVSNKSDENIDFYIVQEARHLAKSTAVKNFVIGKKVKKIESPTITLNALLSKLDVRRIDFLSMDIELWEPHALAGFDIERYGPELVCIEAHREVRDQILSYFTAHNYVRLDQYFLFDHWNWYFVPRANYNKIFDVDF